MCWRSWMVSSYTVVRRVTLRQLHEFLLARGFSVTPTRGSHRVYRHAGTGAMVVLGGTALNAPTSPLHVAAVKGVLRQAGIPYAEFLAELGGH